MARNLGNPFAEPGKTHGIRFEYEVCEHLRRNLPKSYIYRHGVVVSAAIPGRPRRVPREIDVAVAGPNGLFLIEAKHKDRVEGTLMGIWTYMRLNKDGVPNRDPQAEEPGKMMRTKLAQVRALIKKDRRRKFQPFQYARAIFVFPDFTDVRIVDYETTTPPSGDSSFRLVHLSDLAETILTWKSPGPKLTAKEAEALLRILDPGVIDSWPDIVRDYTIVKRGDIQIASNGLPYTINELQHNELDTRRRGKWYDWSALMDKERQQFDEQVKRHATVLAALEGHEHIHQYHEFFSDPYSGGYWLIEEWIDGDTLDAILAAPETMTLNVRQFMRQVALALKSLHDKGFVHRELNPQSILVENRTNRAVITNFELAKALDGSPTVFTEGVEWDPYRAPEVETDPHSVGVTADVYSWGAILFHLATGQQYTGGEALGLLKQSSLPEVIIGLVERCLQPARSNRPASIDEVLRNMKAWRATS